jgi:hypothetical protein
MNTSEPFRIYPRVVSILLLNEDEYRLDKFPQYREYVLDTARINKYISAKFTKDNKVNLLYYKNNGTDETQMVSMKVGKFLLKLLPHLKDTKEILELVANIKGILSSKYEFVISDDVSNIYKEIFIQNNEYLSSCVTARLYNTSFYELQKKHLKILLLYKSSDHTIKNLVGRALLWTNVYGLEPEANKTFLDRIYPADNYHIIEMFRKYADKNKWAYRLFNDNSYKSSRRIVRAIPKVGIYTKLDNINNVEVIPYLDTFCYGNANGILANAQKTIKQVCKVDKVHCKSIKYLKHVEFNVLSKVNDWVTKRDTEDAIYATSNYKKLKNVDFNNIDETNYMKWINGFLYNPNDNRNKMVESIYWHNGIWKDGNFLNGIWKNGTWEKGIFLGDWENGTWKDGIFNHGKWENGKFLNGYFIGQYWKKGKWYNGIFMDSEWYGGTWFDGMWENGTWFKGIWKNGSWLAGTWKNGTWVDGYWHSGCWKNGTWKGGTWNVGLWQNGEWENGEWNDGTWIAGLWKNGTWKKGFWESGIWLDGTFEGGKWVNGIWKDGIWKDGWIFDKDRLGNFKEDWEWSSAGYVHSPINPTEYFDGCTKHIQAYDYLSKNLHDDRNEKLSDSRDARDEDVPPQGPPWWPGPPLRDA